MQNTRFQVDEKQWVFYFCLISDLSGKSLVSCADLRGNKKKKKEIVSMLLHNQLEGGESVSGNKNYRIGVEHSQGDLSCS